MHGDSTVTMYQPQLEGWQGDELQAYSREELVRMDARFVAAIEAAIARGLERPQEGRARAAR